MELSSDIESVKDEEDAAFEILPESLQNSSKGEAMEEAMDAMDNAMGVIEDIVTALETYIVETESLFTDVVDHLQEAIDAK